MFDYWYNLPSELRTHICEWLDIESKFVFGSCTMSHFYDVMNCLDSLYSIIVTPFPISSPKSRPMYNIRLRTENGTGCSLDIIKRYENRTIVEYTLWNDQYKGGWITLINDAYENVATNILKKIIRRSGSTLQKFEILPMANSPRQKELHFDSFNIRNLKNLKFIQLNSNEIGRDFVKTGFVTLKQIQSASEEIVLTNTDVPIEHVCGKGFIDIHQKNLTSADVVKYFEFLQNSGSHTHRTLMMDLIGEKTDPNYINLKIKEQFKRIFEESHSFIENIHDEDSFSIEANNSNNTITFHFYTGDRLYVSQKFNE